MILKGNARGGAANLARHLSNARENDRIEIASLRGGAARDLMGALMDMEAVASGSRCTDHLYSLSINPERPMTRDDYARAIDRIEHRLGLADQPRAVVFHWKRSEATGESREHAHVVWSRVHEVEKRDRDGNSRIVLQAVQMSFDRQRLRELSRELAHELGHRLPENLAKDRGKARFKDDFERASLAEQGQQKRSGLHPSARKAEITAAYFAADTGVAFINALEEKGYYLAQGDKRAFVVVDKALEVHSLTRQIEGAKAAEIKTKLAMAPDQLPTVEQVRQLVAQRQVARAEVADAYSQVKTTYEQQLARHKEMTEAHKAERMALSASYSAKWKDARNRQAEALVQAEKRAKENMRPHWAALFKQHRAEVFAFEQARGTPMKRLRHYLKELKTNKLHDDARGILAAAFNYVVRGKGDPFKMEKAHERARVAMGKIQRQAITQEQRAVRVEWNEHSDHLKEWGKEDRERLRSKHALARVESEHALDAARLAKRDGKSAAQTTRTQGQQADRQQAQTSPRREDWLKAAIPADVLKKAQEAARREREKQQRDEQTRGPRGPYDGGRSR